MICNHQWEYQITHVGSMDYGGPVVLGEHNEERCSLCGKIRMKILKFSKWKLLRTRKENVRHRQVCLL